MNAECQNCKTALNVSTAGSHCCDCWRLRVDLNNELAITYYHYFFYISHQTVKCKFIAGYVNPQSTIVSDNGAIFTISRLILPEDFSELKIKEVEKRVMNMANFK